MATPPVCELTFLFALFLAFDILPLLFLRVRNTRWRFLCGLLQFRREVEVEVEEEVEVEVEVEVE